MAKFIDLDFTTYGFKTDSGFTQTDAILRATIWDDAQGFKFVHGVAEANVEHGAIDSALNRLRRWAKSEGYAEPIRKSRIVEYEGGAFRR